MYSFNPHVGIIGLEGLSNTNLHFMEKFQKEQLINTFTDTCRSKVQKHTNKTHALGGFSRVEPLDFVFFYERW